MHDFSFIADGHVFATQKILIVQGQRNRFITATIGKPGGRGAVAADESAGPATEEQAAKLPVARPRAKMRGGSRQEAAAELDHGRVDRGRVEPPRRRPRPSTAGSCRGC